MPVRAPSVAFSVMGMAVRVPTATIDRLIAAPPEAVWRLLVDPGLWPRWGPSVRHAVLQDGATELALGVRGTVWTAVGVSLPFVVTEFDRGRRWDWSVAGVPATGHRVAAVPGGCLASFDVPWWAAPYLAVCGLALARLDTLARDAQRQ